MPLNQSLNYPMERQMGLVRVFIIWEMYTSKVSRAVAPTCLSIVPLCGGSLFPYNQMS